MTDIKKLTVESVGNMILKVADDALKTGVKASPGMLPAFEAVIGLIESRANSQQIAEAMAKVRQACGLPAKAPATEALK